LQETQSAASMATLGLIGLRSRWSNGPFEYLHVRLKPRLHDPANVQQMYSKYTC